MFVNDVIGNMAIATSVDARGDSSHRKRRVFKKLINGNVSSEFYFIMICECARSCKFYQKLCLALWFYAYKKNKNGNSLRRTAPQRHIRSSFICYGGSDNFGSGISGKFSKIATSNAIFSRTADRIAAKFCMTI